MSEELLTTEAAVRAAVRREVEPMIADCERMLADIDARRDQVDRLLIKLRGVEDDVLQKADERFPGWRT